MKEEVLGKLFQLGGKLEHIINFHVNKRLVSSLKLTNEDLTNPEFNIEEELENWVEGLLPEVERITNEQAESE